MPQTPWGPPVAKPGGVWSGADSRWEPRPEPQCIQPQGCPHGLAPPPANHGSLLKAEPKAPVLDLSPSFSSLCTDMGLLPTVCQEQGLWALSLRAGSGQGLRDAQFQQLLVRPLPEALECFLGPNSSSLLHLCLSLISVSLPISVYPPSLPLPHLCLSSLCLSAQLCSSALLLFSPNPAPSRARLPPDPHLPS